MFITNLLIISCNKYELSEPSKYTVTLTNNYFETIEANIDTVKITKLSPNTISKPVFISKGIYTISCITKSNLLIKSELDLKGSAERINIVLNKQGKIILDSH